MEFTRTNKKSECWQQTYTQSCLCSVLVRCLHQLPLSWAPFQGFQNKYKSFFKKKLAALLRSFQNAYTPCTPMSIRFWGIKVNDPSRAPVVAFQIQNRPAQVAPMFVCTCSLSIYTSYQATGTEENTAPSSVSARISSSVKRHSLHRAHQGFLAWSTTTNLEPKGEAYSRPSSRKTRCGMPRSHR